MDFYWKYTSRNAIQKQFTDLVCIHLLFCSLLLLNKCLFYLNTNSLETFSFYIFCLFKTHFTVVLNFQYISGDSSLEVERAKGFTAWAVITKDLERAQNMIIQKSEILNDSVMWFSKMLFLDNTLSRYYTIWK